mgnify:CR=1 FL=1
MKKLNKKGFTIVELVIVIAVIAILAAVLIPTFATVIEKANRSAAMQNARNAVSTMEMVEDGQIPEGTFYIKSGDYYFTLKDRQLDTDSITKEKPAEDLGGRLYYGNKDFDKVEIYKAGAYTFALRTTDADTSYKGANGSACSISVSANNVITITVNDALEKTKSSNSDQGEAYWVGISLPIGYNYNGETKAIADDDPWLYIKAEKLLNSEKVFTLTKDGKTETYTVKVVKGEKGSFKTENTNGSGS